MSINESKTPRQAGPAGGGQQKLADAQKHPAQNGSGSYQPHNAKKEGLGPNTKR